MTTTSPAGTKPAATGSRDAGSRDAGFHGDGFRAGWAMLARDLTALRRPLLHVAGWSLLQGLPALVSGHVIATALDRGFLVHRPGTGLLYLLALAAALMIGAAATRAMFPWLAATVEPLRDILVRRLTTQAVHNAAATDGPPDSTVVARLTGQVETTRGLVGAILRSARQSAVLLIAAITGLATLAPVVALFILIPLAAATAVFVLSLKMLTDRRRALVLLDEEIAAESGRVLAGVRDIVACNAQDRATANLDRLIGEQASATRRLARASALRTIVVLLGGQLPLLGLLAASPWLIKRGELTPGELIGAAAYVTTGLLPAVQSTVTIVTTWGIQLGTVLQRIHEATSSDPHSSGSAAAPAPAWPSSFLVPPTGYALDIDGLTFAYGAAADPVIEDLHLHLPEGGHLAVVGPSGAGKSTLAALISGGLTPHGGEVRIGGAPITALTEGQRHEIIALIPQEAYVFAGSLRENLEYLRLRPGCTDDELAAAADATGLRALVDRVNGFDAQIGTDGVALSGGEAQLVALTRVYLSEARIVILDEASSQLDPTAEAQVERAFAARPGTLIVIAHRVSSAERAAQVLLLDGAQATLGHPDTLAEHSPLYAELLGYWQPDGKSAVRESNFVIPSAIAPASPADLINEYQEAV